MVGADPGGEPARPRARDERRRRLGHGHDDDGRARRARRHASSFGHVGDSRAYLLRDGKLEQLTDDHSLVAELVRRGELSPAEAEVHPQRSVITRALGTDPDVDVDTFSVAAAAGRRLPALLATGSRRGRRRRRSSRSCAQLPRRPRRGARTALIHAANRGGGEDNITAVLFEIVEGDAERPPSEPDERTRELADAAGTTRRTRSIPRTASRRPPPARRRHRRAVDTMVVSADDDPMPRSPSMRRRRLPQAGLGRRAARAARDRRR